jgi:hypothetical protein
MAPAHPQSPPKTFTSLWVESLGRACPVPLDETSLSYAASCAAPTELARSVPPSESMQHHRPNEGAAWAAGYPGRMSLPRRSALPSLHPPASDSSYSTTPPPVPAKERMRLRIEAEGAAALGHSNGRTTDGGPTPYTPYQAQLARGFSFGAAASGTGSASGTIRSSVDMYATQLRQEVAHLRREMQEIREARLEPPPRYESELK